MQICALISVIAALILPSCCLNKLPQVENKDAIISEISFTETIVAIQRDLTNPKPPEEGYQG